LAVAVYANADDLLMDSDLARFNCLVVDQRLPGLSGLNLVAELRDRQLRVPVILITSQPSRAVVAQADKAGVPIVEKPLLGNALLDKIRVLVVSPTQPSAC
jgi:two-component system, LuxR family, response regulator FixJ